MTDEYDFVAIGSGPAGQRGAVQAAKLGKRVAVVECRPTMGGGSLNSGTIPSKTFREAVISLALSHGTRFRPVQKPAKPTAEELAGCVEAVIRSKSGVVENQ